MELYETRTLLGCTESCLYLYLTFPRSNPTPTRWFTLCRRPTQISNPNPKSRCFIQETRKKGKNSSNNLMISVPNHNDFHVNTLNLITVGYNIYTIGGLINDLQSSKVFFMDCRSHTWNEAPSMRVARGYSHLIVLDGKIYVVDRSKGVNSSNWIECFDPEIKIWEHVPSPDVEIGRSYISRPRLAIKGKLYMFGNKSVVYKPKENRWDEVELAEEMCFGWDHDSDCVIDNVLYCYGGKNKFKWYDVEGKSWRTLEGLEKLPTIPMHYDCVRLVDYGGKIAVLWVKFVGEDTAIWCAEISLEKRKEHVIYGKVEWCDVVLTIPKKHFIS